MSQDAQPATTQDVEDLASAISQLATAVDQGFQDIKQQFKSVDQQFKSVNQRLTDLETGQNRIERKLDPTIDRVDDLQMRVGKLERKTA